MRFFQLPQRWTQKVIISIALFCLFPVLKVVSSERFDIGLFSLSKNIDWQTKHFEGKTEYALVSIDGRQVLKAESESAASALYKEIGVDLAETPFLNWSWRVDRLPSISDEQSKATDDFAARVYVVIKSELLVWRTKSLNYVWSSTAPVGKMWDSPYTGNVKLVALQSGSQKKGNWVKEKRNVRKDLRVAFGSDIRRIDGIAIMTDTDNSGGRAVAYYGDIYFTRN